MVRGSILGTTRSPLYSSSHEVTVGLPLPVPPPPPQPSNRSQPLHADASTSTSSDGFPPPPPLGKGHGALGLPPPPPPPTLQSFTTSTTQVDTPEALLKALEIDGMRSGLLRYWTQIEALHKEERFTSTQIAWIFEQSSRLPTLDYGALRRRQMSDTEAPLGSRLVQLFSNFICERIHELLPSQITIFVIALTSPSLTMDEFWLFMLAKRIQDTTASFDAQQIAAIARRYADKQLEDDEFFEALAKQVTTSIHEISLPTLAHFLLSCAKIRFLHEELCAIAFPLFEDRSRTEVLDGGALSAAITAAALLDCRDFHPMACCVRLAATPEQLQLAAGSSADITMGLLLATVYLRHPAGVRLLLPQLLAHMGGAFMGRKMLGRRGRQEAGMVHRRVVLVGLCGAFGVPRASAWPLALLKCVRDTCFKLEKQLADASGGGRDMWEPSPSSFHLEVVAVLRLLDVEHQVEVKQKPYCLDLTISPAQIQQALKGALSTPVVVG